MKHLLIILLLSGSIAHGQDNLKISVDEGVELMSVVQYLSGQLSNSTPSKYKNDVRNYFLPYRNHAAVQKVFLMDNVYPDLTEFGFLFYGFPDIKHFPLPDSLNWYKYFSKQTIEDYLKLCMQFYKDTKFHTFYTSHIAQYNTWAADFRNQIGEPVKLFNKALQVDKNMNWYICLDPLNDWGAHTYTNKVNPELKKSIVYQQGYFGAKDSLDQMIFKTNVYDIAWHEGTHAISDVILKRFKPQIDSLAGLMRNDEALKRQNITSWQNYFNELIARAVSVALHKKYRDQAQYERLYKGEMARGFIHVKDVSEIIVNDYLDAKKPIPFEEVFPEIFIMLRQKYK